MASNGWISALALLLAGCGGGAPDPAGGSAGLEAAAIERGLVRDPGDMSLTGLYARATDRVCIIERGGGVRIGVSSNYGDGNACAASGIAERRGESLAITFGAAGDCKFDAQYDGERIVFPARLPDGCARFCRQRASLSALSAERLSDTESEAGALRDSAGRPLCATRGD